MTDAMEKIHVNVELQNQMLQHILWQARNWKPLFIRVHIEGDEETH